MRSPGIHEMVYNSISNCYVCIQTELYEISYLEASAKAADVLCTLAIGPVCTRGIMSSGEVLLVSLTA